MTPSNAGYGTSRQDRFTRSGALRPLRSARLARCRRFGPSPCPTHYGGRLATTPSADFCPVTPGVAAGRAAEEGGRVRWRFHPFPDGPQSGSLGSSRPHAGQISPDKDMNYRCTTAAFTLSPVPGGLCHQVLTCPETEPSMRFLFVGSHLCARASFRPPLARRPLPSASSCICPEGQTRYSYRGLQGTFTPSVHVHVGRTLVLAKEQLACSLWIEGRPCRPGELQPTRLTPAVYSGSWRCSLSAVSGVPLSVVRRAAEAGR
jgi:hypothetical protein